MGSRAKRSSAPAVAPPAAPVFAARHIELTGIVQGVGFRPFVYNLALRHGLRGWVCNTSTGVEIEVEGPPHSVHEFELGLTHQAPPRAHIESLAASDILANGHVGFVILPSRAQANAYQLISPDIATCPDCLRELFDPQDRRHGYPFINCTNCGPRFTIIEDIPYDRPKTTMSSFHMCPACQAEYDDPTNRRFHAQPNACPECGPHLTLVLKAHNGPSEAEPRPAPQAILEPAPGQADGETIRQTADLLKNGAILALKGLGGFHLACDATNEMAVQRLRQRKHRPHKPFAVMMSALDEVQRHCWVTPEEAALLTSVAAPIVLLRWREDSSVTRAVAPRNRYLGVMLAYTPLHHLLLREVGRPLVMTSGNRTEEPIAKDNDEALRRLEALADAFVLHDRGIFARYDDSVWSIPLAGTAQPLRRARGYAPTPIRLPFPLVSLLACGADLKNTFCLTRDRYAFVSQHIGDMENLETHVHFVATVALYERLFRARPAAMVCDLHPDYLTTRYAQTRAEREGLPLFAVQHHHAHIASCLADNGWPRDAGPVIGVAMDGTGFGSDGRIWGGEFLVADYRCSERRAHLQYLPLPGGDAAVHKPYRTALACLQSFLGKVPELPFAASIPAEEIEVVRKMVSLGINTPQSSSAGRLFDAVSALLGVCTEASYEAQAAIELEMQTSDLHGAGRTLYPLPVENAGGLHVIRLEALFEALVQAVQAHKPVSEISMIFHASMAHMIAHVCQLLRDETGLQSVALSGGCFQNRVLLRLAAEMLTARGFRVLLHHQVPCNDGGLSLGQALVGHALSGGNE